MSWGGGMAPTRNAASSVWTSGWLGSPLLWQTCPPWASKSTPAFIARCSIGISRVEYLPDLPQFWIWLPASPGSKSPFYAEYAGGHDEKKWGRRRRGKMMDRQTCMGTSSSSIIIIIKY